MSCKTHNLHITINYNCLGSVLYMNSRIFVISLDSISVRETLLTKWNLVKASNILYCTRDHIFMSVEDIGGCCGVAPPIIVLLSYFQLWKRSLWRLLGSKRKLVKASIILSCTRDHVFMSVEDIRGCCGVAPPSIVLLSYFWKKSLWQLLGSKRKLVKASNIL